MFAYAVRSAAGELVGGCELRLAAPDSADVSYWVFPAFRGQGYARRALIEFSACPSAPSPAPSASWT